ncbi:MAG: 30S ribosomal protein S6 [Elusimicrobia bacterium]|nr:30S ribosomal protein S6 [Elusimicrobiota bacterium]
MSYECTFICSPELDSAKLEDISAKVSKIIETADGKIKNLQQLGKKKLAYNIKKFREGNYTYVEFDAAGSVVLSLENFFKVNDDVIRFLTVKVEPKKKVVKKPRGIDSAKAAQPAAEASVENAEVKEEKVEETKTETVNESANVSDTAAK